MEVGMDAAKAEAGQRAAERVALLVALPSSFLTPFMGSSANIALPSIGADLGLPAVELSWVSTAYLLAAAAFLLPFGRIADIVGRKRVLASGLIVYCVSSLLCALAPTGTLLIAARVLQGIGGSMMFATNVAILTSVFAPERRGAALGTSVAATYLGMSLGPVLGGLITEALGWRAVFALSIPVGLAGLLVLAWKLRGEWADARGESFDLTGSLLFMASLGVMMYGVSSLPSAAGIAMIAAGFVGIAAFVLWELRARYPALNMALFRRNRTFAFSNLAALISYSATATVSFFLSLYLQSVRGLTPDTAGFVLVAQPVFQAIFSPIMGRLSDRVEPRILASLGMGLTVIALGLLGFVGGATPLPYIIASLSLLGLGFALFSSPNTNAVMGSVDRRQYGIASATLGTMRLVGNMLSMGVAVMLLALLMGNVPIVPEHFEAFLSCVRTAFPLFAGLCLVGVFASLARGKRQPAAVARPPA
jgi:EmrB/QacA subfamily drug resistance transporter